MDTISNIHTSIIALIMAFVVSACSVNIKDKPDLLRYINDDKNGLVKRDSLGDVQVSLTFVPWQLFAERLGESSNEKALELRDNYFFMLSFSRNNQELLKQLDFDTYSDMVQTLSFNMVNYITANSGNEIVDPEDCLFQHTYGMSGANELLIIFNANKLKRNKDLTIRLREFGLLLGDLKFNYKIRDFEKITNIPLSH